MIEKLSGSFKVKSSKIAVYEKSKTYSYSDLSRSSDTLADQLYKRLRENHESLPHAVALHGDRSAAYIIAVLACWKLGIGVAPISADTPKKRIEYIVDDIGCQFILNCTTNPFELANADVIEAIPNTGTKPSSESRSLPHSDIAYIIYTSGTTGKPKGCVVGFETLGPIVDAFILYYSIESSSRMTFAANISFDASMLEWLPALVAGASVHLIDKNTLLNVDLLVDFYTRSKITFTWLPTTLAEVIMKDTSINLPETLITLQTAGQRLSTRPPRHWHTKVENAYGPTESTIIATSSVTLSEGEELPDIGVPLPGVKCFLLNKDLAQVAPNEIGELHIGGIGVSRGYYKRRTLTERSFFTYTDETGTHHRVYATGDMCRQNTHGNFEFVSRKDSQIKIHGHRVEPGEIVASLMSYPNIRNVHVLSRHAASQDWLIAYVAVGSTSDLDEQAMKDYLRLSLPHYMIPAHIVVLDQFTLTSNGKIDESCLPVPEACLAESKTFHSDELSLQQAQFLNCFNTHMIHDMGWNLDFFSCGGNSIAAISIASDVHRNLNLALPFSLIESARTPKEMWQKLKENDYQQWVVKAWPLDKNRQAPLSSSQRSVWFVCNKEPHNLAYHAKAHVTFEGKLDEYAVRHALQVTVDRNSIFRTTFHPGNGEGIQKIHDNGPVSLATYDLAHLSTYEAKREVDRLVKEDLNAPFHLEILPLVRWALIRLPHDCSVMVHIEHHLVHDGWSYTLFLKDFIHYYRGYCASDKTELEAPMHYYEFCIAQEQWLKSKDATQHLNYWIKQLKNSPSKINLPRRRVNDTPLESGETIRLEFSREKWDEIGQLAIKRGETSFSILFAIFNIVLARYSGDDDICVGSAFANRNWIGADSIIGMIINTVVLRTKLKPNMTLNGLLKQCFETCAKAQEYQSLPFEHVVKALAPDREARVNPLFQIFFGFHDSAMPDLALPKISNATVFEAIDSQAAKFDLSVIVIPREGQSGAGNPVHMLWEFKKVNFKRFNIELMIEEFLLIVDSVIEQDDTKIKFLASNGSLLSGETVSVSEMTMFDRFEASTLRNPIAIAVFSDGEPISYRDLLTWVYGRAQYLIDKGLKQNDRAGICLARGTNNLAWMLACQAVGVTYIPLDPTYPKDRLDYIVKNAEMAAVISDDSQGFHNCLSTNNRLDSFTSPWEVSIQTPMYVIYTSGSTGDPKGVVVSHRAYSNFIGAMSSRFSLANGDVWLAVTSFSFDISTLELYLPLTRGASVVIASDYQVQDPKELILALETHGVTHCQATPTTWRSLTDQGWSPPYSLTVLCGGETMDSELAKCLVVNGATCYNMYGPTETTVWSSIKNLGTSKKPTVTLGQPIANTKLHILNRYYEEVPKGALGQLWISGDSLADGYLHDSKMTSEKFRTLPEINVRIYNTGDIASINSDDELVFHGRNDHQIKMFGYRIELEEIEHVLRQQENVSDAAVVVRYIDSLPQLVAYVTGCTTAEQLYSYCKTKLPKYMVPHEIVVLLKLPVTPNGKIDKNSLPQLTKEPVVAENRQLTKTEALVSECYSLHIGQKQVDINADFFQLGGHSLLAMRLVLELNQMFNVQFGVAKFIELGSIAEISAYIDINRQQDS